MRLALIAVFILIVYASACAEDWMGYVLRYEYQGRDWYWVYDDALQKE